MHILFPNRVEVRMSFLNGSSLLSTHRERFSVSSDKPQPRTQFRQDGLDVGKGATHPLQLGILEPLSTERCANVAVGKRRAVVPIC
jgi:hypothetical protein